MKYFLKTITVLFLIFQTVVGQASTIWINVVNPLPRTVTVWAEFTYTRTSGTSACANVAPVWHNITFPANFSDLEGCNAGASGQAFIQLRLGGASNPYTLYSQTGAGNLGSIYLPTLTKAMPLENKTANGVMGFWLLNDTIVHNEYINPYATVTYTFTYCMSENVKMEAKYSATESQSYIDLSGNFVLTNGINSDSWVVRGGSNDIAGVSSTNTSPLAQGFGTDWNGLATNASNPIDYTGASSDADILRAGFNKLAANQDRESQQLEQIRAKSGGTTTLNSSNISVAVSVSNVFNLGTNVATEKTLAGMSNFWAGYSTNLTGPASVGQQFFGSNFVDYTTALSQANGVASSSGFASAMAGATAFLVGPPTTTEGFTPPTIQLGGGFEMVLDPMGGPWGGVWDSMKVFAAWFLMLAYCVMILKDSYKVVDTMGTAQQMRFPNLELAGFTVGVFIIPVLMIGFLTFFGVCLGLIATAVTGWSSLGIGAAFSNGPMQETGLVGQGFSLLKRAFPIELLIGLGVAYAAFRATMLTVMGVMVAVVRMLIG